MDLTSIKPKENKMKTTNTISLFKVTMGVITAALLSNIVYAEADTIEEKLAPLIVEQLVTEPSKFDELISVLDTDNNGLLSQLELVGSDFEMSKEQFVKFDTNGDSLLSAEEFSRF